MWGNSGGASSPIEKKSYGSELTSLFSSCVGSVVSNYLQTREIHTKQSILFFIVTISVYFFFHRWLLLVAQGIEVWLGCGLFWGVALIGEGIEWGFGWSGWSYNCRLRWKLVCGVSQRRWGWKWVCVGGVVTGWKSRWWLRYWRVQFCWW